MTGRGDGRGTSPRITRACISYAGSRTRSGTSIGTTTQQAAPSSNSLDSDARRQCGPYPVVMTSSLPVCEIRLRPGIRQTLKALATGTSRAPVARRCNSPSVLVVQSGCAWRASRSGSSTTLQPPSGRFGPMAPTEPTGTVSWIAAQIFPCERGTIEVHCVQVGGHSAPGRETDSSVKMDRHCFTPSVVTGTRRIVGRPAANAAEGCYQRLYKQRLNWQARRPVGQYQSLMDPSRAASAA